MSYSHANFEWPRVFAEVVLRQNQGFTLPDDRGKDAENGSILSGSTVYASLTHQHCTAYIQFKFYATKH